MTAANARLKVATVCMNAVPDKEANLQTFFRYMEEAAAQRAKLIVFPEARAEESTDSVVARAGERARSASVLSSRNGLRFMDPFYKIPEYPEHISCTSVLIRLLDGLGFRFHWATEGLRTEDYSYRPGPDTMSVSELVGHIWGLVNWVTISTLGESRQRPEEDESVRSEILDMIWELREAVHSMDEGDLGRITIEGRPFWNMINGPISDALTHVGQVNSFRRLSGNPVPPANVFSGEPPRE